MVIHRPLWLVAAPIRHISLMATFGCLLADARITHEEALAKAGSLTEGMGQFWDALSIRAGSAQLVSLRWLIGTVGHAEICDPGEAYDIQLSQSA